MENDQNAVDVKVKEEEAQTEEDEKERCDASHQRKQLALDALQILAFDGEDATNWQIWLKERLQAQLTSCDVCIRNYHHGKKQMKQKLEEYGYSRVSKLILLTLLKAF